MYIVVVVVVCSTVYVYIYVRERERENQWFVPEGSEPLLVCLALGRFGMRQDCRSTRCAGPGLPWRPAFPLPYSQPILRRLAAHSDSIWVPVCKEEEMLTSLAIWYALSVPPPPESSERDLKCWVSMLMLSVDDHNGRSIVMAQANQPLV